MEKERSEDHAYATSIFLITVVRNESVRFEYNWRSYTLLLYNIIPSRYPINFAMSLVFLRGGVSRGERENGGRKEWKVRRERDTNNFFGAA